MSLTSRNCPVMRALVTLAVTGAAIVSASSAGETNSPKPEGRVTAKWDLPSWIANDQTLKGSFVLNEASAADSIKVAYQLGDGEMQSVACKPSHEEELTYTFALPNFDYDAYGTLSLWIAHVEDEASLTEPQTVGIADWREFDITGETAVELLYPMDSWNMQVRFTPCCLILGALLRVERISVCPVESTEGLPDTLLSPFLHLDPDDVVVATAGLNAEIGFDPDHPAAKDQQAIAVYQWFDGRWVPMRDVTLDAPRNMMRFVALKGGFFVLGPKA